MMSLHDQIACACVHFNGIGNRKCKAGKDYPFSAAELVCFKDRYYVDGQCEARHFPTEEEIADKEKEVTTMFKTYDLLSPIISRLKKEHRGKDYAGIETCPSCGGVLNVTHAKLNGHVSIVCVSNKCFSMIE
jgi:hypothetical protein